MNPDEFMVDEAALETFPASDAPSWTPTHAGGASRFVKQRPPPAMRRRVRADVEALTLAIGERRARVGGLPGLDASAHFVVEAMLEAGRSVTRIPLPANPEVEVVEATIRGVESGEEVVVGARYDGIHAAGGGPIADVSGIVVLLALARHLEERRFSHTVRLVAFADVPVTEEKGALRTPSRLHLGARAYARRLRRQRVRLAGMLSLEDLGFVAGRHERGRESLTHRMLSSWRGDFAAVIGNFGSRRVVSETAEALRVGMHLPVKTFTAPGVLPLVSSSDQRSFWREGFPAVRITDQGPLHGTRSGDVGEDTLARFGHDVMADLVFGLGVVVARLAGGDAPSGESKR